MTAAREPLERPADCRQCGDRAPYPGERCSRCGLRREGEPPPPPGATPPRPAPARKAGK